MRNFIATVALSIVLMLGAGLPAYVSQNNRKED